MCRLRGGANAFSAVSFAASGTGAVIECLDGGPWTTCAKESALVMSGVGLTRRAGEGWGHAWTGDVRMVATSMAVEVSFLILAVAVGGLVGWYQYRSIEVSRERSARKRAARRAKLDASKPNGGDVDPSESD